MVKGYCKVKSGYCIYYVVAKIAEAVRKQRWQVETEQNIWDTNGLRRKPDLLLKKGDNIIVSGIAIYWVGPRPLLIIDTKSEYYSEDKNL